MDTTSATILKEFEELTEEKASLALKEADLIKRATEYNAKLAEAMTKIGHTNGTSNVVEMATHKRTRKPLQKMDLKCSKCDRHFGHALHLGRHMSATHKPRQRAQQSKQRKAS